jgi:hypothetical protein
MAATVGAARHERGIDGVGFAVQPHGRSHPLASRIGNAPLEHLERLVGRHHIRSRRPTKVRRGGEDAMLLVLVLLLL